MLKIRLLSEADLPAVQKAHVESGVDDPATPLQVVGGLSIFDDTTNKCVAFWGIRNFVNAGPLWVDPRYRGQKLSHVLGMGMKVLASENGGMGAISTNPHTAHIFEQLGFEKVGELYAIKGDK